MLFSLANACMQQVLQLGFMLLTPLLRGEQGYGVVRELENVATEEGDKPTHECFIKDCGELPSDDDLTPPAQVCCVVAPTTYTALSCTNPSSFQKVAAILPPSVQSLSQCCRAHQIERSTASCRVSAEVHQRLCQAGRSANVPTRSLPYAFVANDLACILLSGL